MKIIRILFEISLAIGIIVVIVAITTIIIEVKNRTCIETSKFDIGEDSLLSVEGTYCSKWRYN